MGRMTNEEVLKMARRAGAHTAAGVEAIEMNAVKFEKLMWEVLLLRKREADREQAAKFPNATNLLEGAVPQHIDPESDRTQAIGTGYMSTRTCPGTIKAMRDRRDSDSSIVTDRFSLPEDAQ